jgi:acyl carrier protein
MDSNLEQLITRREHILGRVRQILVDELHVRRDRDEIDPDAPLFGTGLGLDSVDAVELVVAMESAFGTRLGDSSEARRWMRTANTLVELVLAAGGEEGGDAARR